MGRSCGLAAAILILVAGQAGALADEAKPDGMQHYALSAWMEPSEALRLSALHPGEVAQANVTVQNCGTESEVIDLSLAVDFRGAPGATGPDYRGDGWNVVLGTRFAGAWLAPSECRNATVSVRAPAKGASGMYIVMRADFVANYGTWPRCNVSFRAYLQTDHHIRFSCPERFHTTAPGVGTVYSFEVRNFGGHAESVELSVEGTPGWETRLSRNEVRVARNGYEYALLHVTPPAGAFADEVGIARVTGRVAEEPEVSDTMSTCTVVSSSMQLELAPDRPEGAALPGGWARYLITARNLGNYGTRVPLGLEAVADRPGWGASIGNGSLGLEGGATCVTALTVTVPPDAEAGSFATVAVTCRNLPGTVTAACAVITRVALVQGLAVKASPVDDSAGPGESAGFCISLENLGNGYDVFRVEWPALPAGWSARCLDSYGGEVHGELALAPGKAASLEALVTVGEGEGAGLRTVGGRVVDGAGNAHPFSLGVTVERVSLVELAAPSPKSSGTLGCRVLFPLEVTSRGNWFDDVWFSASNLPDGWPPVEFLDAGNRSLDGMVLEPFGTGLLWAAVSVPDSTPADRARFSVTATASDGSRAVVELALRVLKPELRIAFLGPLFPEARPGREIPVQVGVWNLGEAPTGNFSVAFSLNGLPCREVRLGPLGAGECVTALFVWVPVEGDNALRFEADPADAVCERNETNNAVDFWTAVSRGDPARPPEAAGREGADIGLLLALAFVAPLLLRARQRSRRRGREDLIKSPPLQ